MSKTIKAIDKEAVHRICSGQVVLNLATAVKELVENSLDAGATTVEVRLREYGSDLIEVSDNGSGVLPANFEGLTAKHHTSKLQDFSDLVNVETFGFRGEALSSLCALSDVSIVTKHESEAVGSKLAFDHRGNIASVTPIARQVGTTVTVEKLFKSLPVRQKEFHRNLKREYFKMVQLLNAYGLVSTNVRISCSNQTKKGGRSVVMSTHGCKSVRENIACIFGSKQLNSLLDLEKVLPDSEVLTELKVKEEDADKFDLDGIISSCAHGQGRSSGDRQFYYINNRPCEPSKIVKCVNEVYHSFNLHQTPFVFLNITAARNSVDVNVTPDKRQIFLDHEKLLIATIKASLMKLYEKIPSTFQVNNVFSFGRSDTSSDPTIVDNQMSSENNSSPSKLSLSKWRHLSDKETSDISTTKRKVENKINPPAKQMKLDEKFVISQRGPSNSDKIGSLDISGTAAYQNNIEKIYENAPSNDDSQDNLNSASQTSEISTAFSIDSVESSLSIEIFDPSSSKIKSETSSVASYDELVNSQSSTASLISSQKSSISVEIIDSNSFKTQSSSMFNGIDVDVKEIDRIKVTSCENVEFDGSESLNVQNGGDEGMESYELVKNSQPEVVICDSVPSCDDSKKTVIVDNVSVKSIKEALEQLQLEEDNENQKSVTNKFHATIDPTKNNQAENELRREISKDSFAKMEIIGQFNLGFIIVQLGTDLFIVDQHATDEKYNFETLQLTTTISNQKLVVPQTLELTAANESLLLDNMEVFKKNGFQFTIDENAEPMKKVKLTAIPISQNWHFGKDDIDELLFMLQDSPGTLCRPSRVRAMFASRACRMSVMIGTALSVAEMKKLVVHMGEIEQPWNCPHGRPTMRHLINLALLH